MEQRAIKREILQRAQLRLGRDDLARHLDVPPALVDSWIRGNGAIPDGKLMVLACLLDHAGRSQ
jgi:hypothetical protein